MMASIVNMKWLNMLVRKENALFLLKVMGRKYVDCMNWGVAKNPK